VNAGIEFNLPKYLLMFGRKIEFWAINRKKNGDNPKNPRRKAKIF